MIGRVMALLDRDIREPLFLFFELKYGKVRFIEEKDIGRARADVMMVTDDAVTGLEIKSDADSYVRLKKQVRYYDKYFDYNYAVVGKSHSLHIEEHIPKYWGVLVCFEDEDGVHFEEVKEPERNPKRKIDLKMSLLWRNELNNIRDDCLRYKYEHLSKPALRAKLIEKVSEDKLDELISRELFNRDYTKYM